MNYKKRNLLAEKTNNPAQASKLTYRYASSVAKVLTWKWISLCQ